jgi:hypothetical protein
MAGWNLIAFSGSSPALFEDLTTYANLAGPNACGQAKVALNRDFIAGGLTRALRLAPGD